MNSVTQSFIRVAPLSCSISAELRNVQHRAALLDPELVSH